MIAISDELRPFLITLAAILGIALPLVGIAAFALKRRNPTLGREIVVRYVAWVVIGALFSAGLVAGRTAWIVLVGIVSLLAFREYARAVGLWLDRTFLTVGYVFVVLFHFVAWYPWDPLGPGRGWYGIFQAMPAYATLAVLAVPIVRGKFEHMVQKTCLAVLGVIYFGWLFAHLAFLVNLDHGAALAFFLLLLIALNDVSAFIVGKFFGKHKLRPTLSPGKTWEGAIGALLIVMGVGYALGPLVPFIPTSHLLAISAIISASGTMGDLALSTIKRDLGIKDWSAAIPGHGGILDRTNSLIFAVPLFFHYSRYFYV